MCFLIELRIELKNYIIFRFLLFQVVINKYYSKGRIESLPLGNNQLHAVDYLG